MALDLQRLLVMSKKIGTVAVGLALFLSLSPSLASAQPVNNNGGQPSLITLFEQLVQALTAELSQLEKSLAQSLSGMRTSGQVSPPATGNSSQSTNFYASPTSGNAPLTVAFTSNTSGTVNFGDGKSSGMAFNDAVYETSHTYTAAGTYTATLTAPCTGTGCTPVVLGSVTITVSRSSPPVTQPGGHCGGNIVNAPTCPTGYYCDLNGYPPDTGGICVAN